MKSFFTYLCVLGGLVLSGFSANAQDAWPKTFTTAEGSVIKMYQWQPESYTGNNLQAKAAVSVLESGKTDPVFGMTWIKASTSNNGSRVQVEKASVENLKLPGDISDDRLDSYTEALEQQINRGNINFAQTDLQSSLDLNNQQTQLSQQISNNPPKVVYSNTPAILVSIDGAPKLQRNNDWDVEAVVNTPFTIVKNNDGRFYLYGGKHWYAGSAATGPYSLTTQIPQHFNKIAQQVNDADKDNNTEKETDANTMYKIVVSTEPAELIQSNGEANFAPVSGTDLLYVSNSGDDIFMDVQSQQYYVLISGRWFKSKTLSGQWQFVPSDKLPQDFAKIPEGSAKDNVLASVAGTAASQDALQDAEVPQTAKVDRQQAKADVAYDGDPQFEDIDGTEMEYAINTSASVIRWRGRYYSVDNGIWFESYSAAGPWSVAVVRPSVVALIPPRYPVYHMKYVYIYDYTPDYVWMGYTPGYLNNYICGSSVVYGTGYYYNPWYGHNYYARPYTWGFNIRYNPWFGWGFGFNYNSGWFHSNVGWGNSWGYGYGGWWGPRVYRPSYCYAPYRSHGGYYSGGYYGNGYRSRTNVNVVQINRTNNIYNYYGGRGVVSRDNRRVDPNTGRTFNRGGYANRNYNNGNYSRGGARYDNNNNYNRPNNDSRFTSRPRVSDRSTAGPRGDDRNGNNTPGRSIDNGSQRPSREWRPTTSDRNGSFGGRPGAVADQPSRERVIRDNNSRSENRPDPGTSRPSPVTREPRASQSPVRGNDEGRQWQSRPNSGGGERSFPGRSAQPQPAPQREASAPPQRTFDRPSVGGGGRSGGDQGGSRPSFGGGGRSGGEQGGARPSRGGEGGGGSERPGRRG
ncbi:hypothetical protein [Paraflavitalea sp. CAU 1676]|uniref:hypothetical protein n=1 Tax=Paraflavitalea sp. CAU 1676 TaxID=3032598 RepID=UPI0023DBE6C3|nr:hypothetical protein [Paraflavitalea sp. CAU 1676]MDF2190983.1 hypothetical protein [Paraflavitalea sp. CAU 1676]